MNHPIRLLTATIGLLSAPSLALGFDAILTSGHADIGLGYTSLGGWDLHVHDDETNTEFEPGNALLYAGIDARVNRPAGSQFDFIGVGAGQQFWLIPQSQNPNILFLGIGTEEIESGSFASYLETDSRVNQNGAWVKLSLAAVRGPGEVSMWSNDAFGPKVWWATSDGISSSDATYVLSGSHAHFNIAFTAPGLYEVDVEASAFQGPGATNPSSSGVVTYHFGVEAVPEPTSTLLLSLGALSIAARRRRRS